jgi:hypothetical protein
MRLLSFALLAAALSTGCGSGYYTAHTSGDGSTVILNSYTGNVQRVDKNGLTTLTELGKATPTTTHKLPNNGIAKQPLVLSGSAKFYSGQMLVRVVVSPDVAPKTPEDWTVWRNHIANTVITAGLDLNFTDIEGFHLFQKSVSLSEFTRTVGADNEPYEYDAQFAVPMSEDDYRSVNSWLVGWHGYWPTYSPRQSPQKN